MMDHLDSQRHHTDWKEKLLLYLLIQRYILNDKHLKATTGKKNHTLVRQEKEIRGNKHRNRKRAKCSDSAEERKNMGFFLL